MRTADQGSPRCALDPGPPALSSFQEQWTGVTALEGDFTMAGAIFLNLMAMGLVFSLVLRTD